MSDGKELLTTDQDGSLSSERRYDAPHAIHGAEPHLPGLERAVPQLAAVAASRRR